MCFLVLQIFTAGELSELAAGLPLLVRWLLPGLSSINLSNPFLI